MGRNSVESYGSKGRSDVLYFNPEEVAVVYDSRHPKYDAKMFLPIDIDNAKFETDHPLYDPEIHDPLEEGRVLNFMAIGIHTPGGVRRNGMRQNDTPIIEVVFGRRRVLHARAANKRLAKEGREPIRFPATIKRGKDAELMDLWVSENVHRKTVSPLALAQSIQRYLSLNRSNEEAAVLFDMTTQTVRYYLSFLECDKSVHKAVEAGKITASLAAQEFSKIPREEQSEALKKLLEASGGVAKGAAAKETLGRIRNNGASSKNGTAKRRSPKAIKGAMKTLTKLERQDSKAMIAILKWVLGADNSFGDFKAVDEALYPEERAS